MAIHNKANTVFRKNRRTFEKLVARGDNLGVRIEATYQHSTDRGHMLLTDARTKAGIEDHIWINCQAVDNAPSLQHGDKIQFFAELQRYRKRDGSISFRVEAVREVSKILTIDKAVA